MNLSYLHPADQLVMFMQRIYDRGLTTTSGGNLSIRDSDGNIWITPAAVDKGSLTRRDMICVRPDGTVEGPHRPSSELPFHTSVYRMRPDLHAVLHAHPPALVSFSMVRRAPDLDLLPYLRQVCGEARVAAYGVPGSEDLGRKIGKVFSEGCDIAILENHGVCVGGPDLFTAFRRFETMEAAARLEMTARRLAALRGPAGVHPFQPLDTFVPMAPGSEELAARRELITMIRRAYRTGLFTAAEGTYSVRLSDGSFLITPHGQDRLYLEEADLVLVRDGRAEAGKLPSHSAFLHRCIYEAHPTIGAVLIAHPTHAMAFACTDAQLDPRTIPESYVLLRDIEKLPAAPFYENPRQAAQFFGPATPVALLQNDCAILTGDNLLQAFDRLEVLESTAQSILSCQALGDIVHITDPEIADLKKAFHLVD